MKVKEVNLLSPTYQRELGRLGKSPLPAFEVLLQVFKARKVCFTGMHLE